MNLSDDEIAEFCNEAMDLLDIAEDGLLKLDKGGEFKSNYDSVFRVFHSLKGGAGMVGLEDLQSHMHKLENTLSEAKARNQLTRNEISLFLRGADAARKLLAGEKLASFDYSAGDAPAQSSQKSSSPVAPAQAPAQPSASPTAVADSPVTTGMAPAASGASRSPEPKPAGRQANSMQGPALAYIVDDEPEIVEILQEMLSSTGMKVQAFTKPQDLLTATNNLRPDLILTDFKMPGFSGMQVLEAAQKIDPDLPVIFLSGYLTKDVLVDAINKGAFAALDKPFRDGDVIAYCNSAVKQYRALRAFRQSMNLLVYQFTDLDDFLKAQGKNDLRETLRHEIDHLLECKRNLKGLL